MPPTRSLTPIITNTPTIRSASPILLATRLPTATTTPRPSPTASDGIERISVGEDYYYPPEVTIKVGTVVEWTLDGIRAHTVTSRDGAWLPVFLDVGISYRLTFNKPGIYHYTCTLHPGMNGTIEVIP